MRPDFITFTGIDDRTDLNRAHELASRYPIEWGVLCSSSNRDARFPSIQTIRSLFDGVAGKKSAHLCGALARAAGEGLLFSDPVIYEELHLDCFDRLQINGCKKETMHIRAFEKALDLRVILQVASDGFRATRLDELYDCSGGTGKFPDTVPPHPGGGRLVGYAGGMGPDTVMRYLDMLKDCEGPYWIDMEGRVRTEGWFDLDKVEAVCQQVYG